MTKTIAADEAAQMFEACADALRGHHPYLQGAVLADLLAMWLAEFHVGDNPKATEQLRQNVLEKHLEQVQVLIGKNEKILRNRAASATRHHH